MRRKVGKKGSTLIITLIVFLILVGGTYFWITQQGNLTKQNKTFNPNINQDEVTISGSVLDNDRSCSYDGVCKVKVDDYWVITDLGGDPSPEMEKQRGPRGRITTADGKTIRGIGNNMSGKQVEVFAKVIDSNTLTLYGKRDYYIKFKD